MIEIKPTDNIANYKDKLEEHGISNDNAMIIVAEDGKEIGHLISYIENAILHIVEVECGDDIYLYDGVVRAALNSAMTRNIDKAQFHVKDMGILKKLCFVKDGEENIESIMKFLSKCKSCNIDK
ncbi:MAG: hypothetical protein GX967_02460 [Clostridiales bacterium]|nr:hypothetical protein [Clostridiales bacterium]